MKKNLGRKYLLRMMFLYIHNIWEVGCYSAFKTQILSMSSASFVLMARKLLPLDFYHINNNLLLMPANIEKSRGEEGWVAVYSNLCKL